MLLALPFKVTPLWAKEESSDSMSNAFRNHIGIQTGQIRDGEQIPLPFFQDGKQARRQEAYYLVSPAEIPTSLTYIATSGAFYIKCNVDQEGFVHISLWQQSGTGQGVKVVGSDTYRLLKERFTTEGITSAAGEEDDENVATAQMRVLSERLSVNYMVIALRSPKK